ncbi:MAG: hypothetical protein HW380_3566 [Magnetococcales bacterium]|nr:hypothetical protein [Magnetococcales bacterium]
MIDACQTADHDSLCPCFLQGFGRRPYGGTGGKNIVHQENRAVFDHATSGKKGIMDIMLPVFLVQSNLWPGHFDTMQTICHQGTMEFFCQSTCQQRRLIVTAPQQAKWMQGDGDDQVEVFPDQMIAHPFHGEMDQVFRPFGAVTEFIPDDQVGHGFLIEKGKVYTVGVMVIEQAGAATKHRLAGGGAAMEATIFRHGRQSFEASAT